MSHFHIELIYPWRGTMRLSRRFNCIFDAILDAHRVLEDPVAAGTALVKDHGIKIAVVNRDDTLYKISFEP